MRGSISLRSILATVAVLTSDRLASSAWVNAWRVLCFFSLSPIWTIVAGILATSWVGLTPLLNATCGDPRYGAGLFASGPKAIVGIGFTDLRGGLYVERDLRVSGAKSAMVAHPEGSQQLLYALESPGSWFEDFGRAQVL